MYEHETCGFVTYYIKIFLYSGVTYCYGIQMIYVHLFCEWYS